MDLVKEGVLSKNARELEEHIGNAAMQITAWAVEVQSSLSHIGHNTRGLLWWTSIAAVIIASLFIVSAIHTLRRVLVEINQHQALFRHMWEEDRQLEAEQRLRDEQIRADHAARLREAIAAVRDGRGKEGRHGDDGWGSGSGRGGRPDAAAVAAAAAAAEEEEEEDDDQEARFAQMEADIAIIEAERLRNPDSEWVRRRAREIHAQYADLFPPPEHREEWEIDPDEEEGA